MDWRKRFHATGVNGHMFLWVLSMVILYSVSVSIPAVVCADIRQDVEQRPIIRFTRLSLDDGLLENAIYSIAQDKTGFLWFGTQSGLSRYDGYSFTHYRSDDSTTDRISNDNISHLLCDHEGRLWVATWGGGLDCIELTTGRLRHYRNDPADSRTLSHDRVQVTFQDSHGNVWVGTSGGGLNLLEKDTGTFTVFTSDPADLTSLSHDRIWDIVEDHEDRLWIATSEGLNRYDPAVKGFIRYVANPAVPNGLRDNLIRALHVDRQGVLWIGTDNGLHRYNRRSDDFSVYIHDPKRSDSLNDHTINCIYEDSQQRFWVGTRTGGLNLFDREREIFTHYTHDPNLSTSLSYNDIRCIFEDNAGVLWIGTRGGGVNKIVLNAGKFIHWGSGRDLFVQVANNEIRTLLIDDDQDETMWFGTRGGGLVHVRNRTAEIITYLYNPNNTEGLSSNDVNSLVKGRNDIVWLGTSGGGLNKFDIRRRIFTRFEHDPADPASISHNDVTCLYEDREGTLWVGTKGGGLNSFDAETVRFTRYTHDPVRLDSLPSADVNAIVEDDLERLWIGTYGGGLALLDRKTGEFRVFQHNPDDSSSLSNNNIFCLLPKSDGTLVIGTANGGLNILASDLSGFRRMTRREGLASDVVLSVEEDLAGNLWLATNKGLSMISTSKRQIVNFDSSDGIERVAYRQNASFRDVSGRLYFGGFNGLTCFNPAQIKDNSYVPPVVLTKILLSGEPLVTDRPIYEIKELTLAYYQNILSFDFAALDFSNPPTNRFAYKLDGFDPNWNDSGVRHFATYTNLDPGRYVLQVKGTNNAGVWNTRGASLAIIITPPFWGTWWFRILAAIGTVLIVLAVFSLRVRAIQSQKRLLQSQVAEKTNDLLVLNHNLTTVTERLQNEMSLARQIQEGILQLPNPCWADLDVLCYCKSAHEVGGDFYLYHHITAETGMGNLPETRYILIVGDVSGKGMPAALLMSISLGSLVSILDQKPDRVTILKRLDETLRPYAKTTRQFCAISHVELTGNSLSVINAGGMMPLLLKPDGSLDWIDSVGLPLGLYLEPHPPIREEHERRLEKGDMIIIMSDGLIEAMDANHQLFGLDRFEQVVRKGPRFSAESMLQHIVKAIDAFMADTEPYDDLTIIVVRVPD